MGHRTDLLSNHIWIPEIKRLGLDSVACSILSSLHSRHIGISPELAGGLSRVIVRQRTCTRGEDDPLGNAQSSWNKVVARLEDALQNERDVGRHGRKGNRLLALAAPSYFVLRIAAFLLSRTCHAAGRTILFSEDRFRFGAVSAKKYQKHCCELNDHFTDTVNSKSKEIELFFWDAASVMTAHNRFATPQTSMLPQSDPVDAALFRKLRTTDPQGRPRHAARRTADAQRHRHLRKPKHGGINGITVTRSVEDMNDMDLRELLQPDLIRLERLFNSGFHARHRPPFRQQKQDALVVLMVPGDFDNTPVPGFIETIWCDLCVRLGHRLSESGLLKSEFRLIQGDRIGRFRSQSFHLDDMTRPEFAGRSRHPSELFRCDFKSSLRWYPRLMNQHDFFESVRRPGPTQTQQRHSACDWAEAALASQRVKGADTEGNRSSIRRTPDGTGQLDLAMYRYSHVMLLLPNTDLKEPAHGRLSDLTARLFHGRPAGQHASLTWIPRNLDPDSDWVFEAHGTRSECVMDGLTRPGAVDDHLENMADVGSRLAGEWFDQIERELWQ